MILFGNNLLMAPCKIVINQLTHWNKKSAEIAFCRGKSADYKV